MRIVIRLLVVAGLAVDAYVHAHRASDFRFNNDGWISGEWLFRLEALAAAAVALAVLIWANRLWYALAFVVATAGVAAVVLFSQVNIGAVGPLPTIYEPTWYAEKTVSLIGEAIAAVAALAGFLGIPRRALIPAEEGGAVISGK